MSRSTSDDAPSEASDKGYPRTSCKRHEGSSGGPTEGIVRGKSGEYCGAKCCSGTDSKSF